MQFQVLFLKFSVEKCESVQNKADLDMFIKEIMCGIVDLHSEQQFALFATRAR